MESDFKNEFWAKTHKLGAQAVKNVVMINLSKTRYFLAIFCQWIKWDLIIFISGKATAGKAVTCKSQEEGSGLHLGKAISISLDDRIEIFGAEKIPTCHAIYCVRCLSHSWSIADLSVGHYYIFCRLRTDFMISGLMAIVSRKTILRLV